MGTTVAWGADGAEMEEEEAVESDEPFDGGGDIIADSEDWSLKEGVS